MRTYFKTRIEAGQELAQQLRHYADRSDVVILALPRGGVPVGYEVAKALHAPLDICVVRKLGLPDYPELAIGAIASGGVQIFNLDILRHYPVSADRITQIADQEAIELDRRQQCYRGNRLPFDLTGKTVILVDDGIATGATLRAAIASVRTQQAHRIVVAVPVASPLILRQIQVEVDEAMALLQPDPFYSVGTWYGNFAQTSDEAVRAYLDQAQQNYAVIQSGKLPRAKARSFQQP